MRRLRFRAAATLLLLLCGTPLYAQDLLPQAFLAPPRLQEKSQFDNELLAEAVLIAGCRPEGDITRDGNLVTLHIVAKEASNQINNPTSPNTKATPRNKRVMLRFWVSEARLCNSILDGMRRL